MTVFGWFFMNMKTIQELHQAAYEQGFDTYIDPASGFQVMTCNALLKQGRCCGNSCRHCPYGHINVPKLDGDKRIPTT
jgi:hypothetical protein